MPPFPSQLCFFMGGGPPPGGGGGGGGVCVVGVSFVPTTRISMLPAHERAEAEDEWEREKQRLAEEKAEVLGQLADTAPSPPSPRTQAPFSGQMARVNVGVGVGYMC